MRQLTYPEQPEGSVAHSPDAHAAALHCHSALSDPGLWPLPAVFHGILDCEEKGPDTMRATQSNEKRRTSSMLMITAYRLDFS